MPAGFYELKVWKQSYDLLMRIYDLTQKYPPEEKYALVQQTRRSANSVTSNIAESHGRYYFKDKIRVAYISRGEIEETQSHLRVARGRNYLSLEVFEKINRDYENLAIDLNGYINDLYSKANEQQIQNKG
jgi:four helix bundle protein